MGCGASSSKKPRQDAVVALDGTKLNDDSSFVGGDPELFQRARPRPTNPTPGGDDADGQTVDNFQGAREVMQNRQDTEMLVLESADSEDLNGSFQNRIDRDLPQPSNPTRLRPVGAAAEQQAQGMHGGLRLAPVKQPTVVHVPSVKVPAAQKDAAARMAEQRAKFENRRGVGEGGGGGGWRPPGEASPSHGLRGGLDESPGPGFADAGLPGALETLDTGGNGGGGLNMMKAPAQQPRRKKFDDDDERLMDDILEELKD